MIELVNIVLFFIFLTLLYILVFSRVRQIYLGRKKKDFECMRCGKCCTLRVKPSKKDLERILKAGYKKEDFLDRGWIKRVNKACYFLKKNRNGTYCSIYNHRPDTCRGWPFSAFFRGRFIYARLYSCPGLARINKTRYL